MRNFLTSRGRHRIAFTLVELLIVIGILSLLAAVTLPGVRDIIREQKFSRTAGVIQSYIAGAQAKAIGEGRAYGVVIERAGTDSAIGRAHSVRLSYAYAPPAYAGDLAGARAVVTTNGNLTFNPADAATLQAAANQAINNVNNPVIGVGDSIGIGLVPFYFGINGLGILSSSGDSVPVVPPNANQWPILFLNGAAQSQILAQYPPGTELPFRIIRRPTPSLTAPLELPEGTAIDLVYSGVGLFGDDFSPLAIENRRLDASNVPITNRYGTTTYAPATSTPFLAGDIDFESITIMFDSTGAVTEVRMGAPLNLPSNDVVVTGGFATSNIFLMLGKLEGIYPDAPFFVTNRDRANLNDFESSWIVINRLTGEVAASPISAYGIDASGNILDPNSGLIVAAATSPLQTRLQAAIALSRAEAAAYSAVDQ